MKKLLILAVILCSGQFVLSQKSEVITNPDLIPITYHGVTGRLDQYVEPHNTVNERTKDEKIGYHPKSDWILNPTVNPNALPKNGDPAHQKDYTPANTQKVLSQNWDGMGYTGVNPADPSVDVGPNHVVQMINGASGSYIQIWNKTGTSLMAPVYFDNFMSMPGGAGDPIVLYDERADRWLLSEFSAGGNNMHVAISTTNDPTGTYYTYSFNAPSFPDYPKYSIWENDYIITTNETQSTLYALDRTSLLAGTPAAAQRFTMTNFGTIGFQAATPVSLNGTAVPPAGTPSMVMRMRDDAWAGSASDALEIWEMDIDWVTPANSTLIQTSVLATTPHESELCGYTSFACIPQPGTGTTLDPLRELLMNRIHYRNFGTHESIVCCHVTDVNGADLAGIRWYELRRTGGTAGSWAIYQEGTYSPDADNRWMPSIGISATGNIGLAYNVSSGTTFPSLRYTGRKECDPLNMMTEAETVIIAGSGSNASNRYGDYNALGLDPSDGETFWFTGMYNASNQWSTRVAAFDIPTCAPNVSFAASTYTVNEPDANVANGCLDYYILNVPISIGSAPSQPADVTVTITGGTATQGVDYDIFNTSFTFSGTTLSGTAEIWVYNDNYVEGNETIDLAYTLNANGGNATNGTINQTVTVTINDDDLAPAAMTNTTVIFADDFNDGTLAPITTANVGTPADTPWQIGNNTSVPNGAFSIPATNPTDFAWIDDDDCDCDQNDVWLYLPQINLSTYLSAQMTFNSYFEAQTWAGDVEAAEVRVSTNGGGTWTTIQSVAASQVDVDWVPNLVDLTPYVGNATVDLAIHYSDGTGWLYGCAVDDFVITGESPIGIQTVVNSGSGMTANLGPNETVHFYDPATSDVMMSIVNTSAWDYGCVTVEVDREGTTPTAMQFNSAAVPDFVHEKTYTVVPTNANPTGTFDVTLYYEEAEVAAWEAFTGNSRNNAEIIKVAGNNQISDVTPANYTTYTINNITATLGAFNTDVTFTSSFTNGFSGFGVGIYNVPTTVTHTVVITNPTCAGGNDGMIVVTGANGTAPYEYSIDNGTNWVASNTFTGLSAGSYQVLVRDAGLNQSVMTVETLTDPPAITFSSSSTNENCGQSDGTVTITASGGTGSLQYSLNGSPLQASGNFTGLAAGTHSIMVEDGNGCQVTGSVTVGSTAGPSISSINSVDPSCNGGTDGSITINATGGTAPLQYSINGGTLQSGSSFTGLGAGSYTLLVEDANGCQATTTGTITAPSAVSFTSSSTDENCGSSDGTVTLAGSGGTGTLQYSLNGSPLQSSGNFSGLTAGTYSIVVQDINGCQATGSITVGSSAGPSITSVNGTDPLCDGGSDGSIVINASGGTPGYMYSINGGTLQASNTFTGLSAGSYSVLVEDANGCQATSNVTLNNPPALTYSATSTSANCGLPDGSISVTGSGGTGALQYSINGGTLQSSGLFVGLSSGAYTILVQDANGCQTTGIETVGSNGGPSITNVTALDPLCNGDSNGSISVTASGGAAPLMYSINGGTLQSGSSFTGLSAGSYVILVEDNNGCQSTTNITLTDPPVLTVSVAGTDATCNGVCDAIGTSTVSGGTSPYTYSWSNGATTPNITDGCAGTTYTLTVTDANGCTASDSFTPSEPSAVTISSSSTDENCGAIDGTITITGGGGTPAYMYSINGGTLQSSGNFTGLTAGTYTVLVEDANGCQATSTQVVNGSGGPTISSTTNVDPLCNGDANGSIDVSVTGGASPIQYSINGGTLQSGSMFTGLIAGSYTVLAQDANGCQFSTVVVLIDPAVISYTASSTNANCGANDGTLTITGSGGTGTLMYSVGASPLQSSGTFTGLAAGSHTILIEDANGCQLTSTETIGTNGGATINSITVVDPLCNSDANGSITINASGGAAPLMYSVNGGTLQGSNMFSSLAAGTYSLIVEDANGCQTSGSVTLTDPTVISFTSTTTDATCGLSDGSITITGSGGTGALMYSVNGSPLQSSGTFNGLPAGSYTVLVEDANGCQTTGTVNVNNANGPNIIQVDVIEPLCFGTGGSLTINASGGTAPLNYSIDGGLNFQSSNVFNNAFSAGTLTIVVEDAAGCSTSTTIVVNEPTEMIGSFTIINTTCGMDNGIAIANVTGGVPNYNYYWEGNLIPTNVAVNLAAGNYTMEVEDANGCVLVMQATIEDSDSMSLGVEVTHESCTGAADGWISLAVTGGSGTISYLWSTGDSTANIQDLTANTYVVSISDSNGCVINESIEIYTDNLACLSIPTAISPNGDGSNDVWVISGLDVYPDALVEIYNRWGTILFNTNDYQNNWDGKYKDNDLPAGVYYYIVKISDDEVYTGSLTILR